MKKITVIVLITLLALLLMAMLPSHDARPGRIWRQLQAIERPAAQEQAAEAYPAPVETTAPADAYPAPEPTPTYRMRCAPYPGGIYCAPGH